MLLKDIGIRFNQSILLDLMESGELPKLDKDSYRHTTENGQYGFIAKRNKSFDLGQGNRLGTWTNTPNTNKRIFSNHRLFENEIVFPSSEKVISRGG
ncbi:MAG TPA: hypothetical protein ENI07_01250 [Desulfobacterales bacterium]|nr:hypothetical protein [Desulfobacterales bacterium]